MPELCLRVAVGVPVRHAYDYLPPERGAPPPPGCRVLVPFGRQSRIGLVLEHREASAGGPALKRVRRALDEAPAVGEDVLDLVCWAAGYYRHPVGLVAEAALPARLRRGESASLTGTTRWRLTAAGRAEDPETHRRAPVRRRLLTALGAAPEGLEPGNLCAVHPDPHAQLRWLRQHGLAEPAQFLPPPPPARVPPDVAHNPAQRAAIDALREGLGAYRCTLLHGVTGSGKTEVYRAVLAALRARGGQALVLAPEIGLVPQLRDRLAADAGARIAVYHSECTAREQHLAWLQAQSGAADLVVGTRSAVFLPFADLRLIIVDEEHDGSLRQQEGFRYHARDVAVYRAWKGGLPVILGAATPSIETWRNVRSGKYARLSLPDRAGAAEPPAVELIDTGRHPAEDGLSAPLLAALRQTLDRGEQAMLFLNRRGYAPALYLPGEETALSCPHCLTCLVYHRPREQALCHHCGFRQPAAEALERGAQLLGQGTQRVEDRLQAEFPDCAVLRLDRDRIRRRGELERSLERLRRGDYQLVVGTQMLCKGHDFPNVTLVGIVHIDAQLFSPRLRAPEELAQVLVQVSGRAGRGVKPGRVLLQTALPRHPLLRRLLEGSYEDWLERLLEERRELALPPFGYWALVRAQHEEYRRAEEFLLRVRTQLRGGGAAVLGPAPALMAKRAGLWRAQLLLKAESRQALERCLDGWLSRGAPGGRRGVQWSLEVDPLDIA